MKKQLDEDGKELETTAKARWEVGVNGAHLMCVFQCELCHFRNIYGRNPRPERSKDVYAMVTISDQVDKDSFCE